MKLPYLRSNGNSNVASQQWRCHCCDTVPYFVSGELRARNGLRSKFVTSMVVRNACVFVKGDTPVSSHAGPIRVSELGFEPDLVCENFHKVFGLISVDLLRAARRLVRGVVIRVTLKHWGFDAQILDVDRFQATTDFPSSVLR